MSEKYRVIIQPEAEQGIKQAYYWVSKYSPRQARQWLEGIYQAVMSLEKMPLRCSLAFENNFFEEEIRQLLYGKGKIPIASCLQLSMRQVQYKFYMFAILLKNLSPLMMRKSRRRSPLLIILFV